MRECGWLNECGTDKLKSDRQTTVTSSSVGYQTSDADGSTSTQDDEATLMSISYAVTDDLSISYGTAEVDLGSSTTDQESKGISASYTMGGVSISVAMNETENAGGQTTAAYDLEGYDLNVAFAF